METLCKEHNQESQIQLKGGGLKITAARLQLLDILKHAKTPLTVKQIASKLKQADIVTLYRNLQALEKLNIVNPIRLGGKELSYELAAQKHHHHLVCQNCGKIADIEGCKISLSHKILKQSGFAELDTHSLEFFGLCKACAK